MRAVINATGYYYPLKSLLIDKPTPLLCVLDRPILFHVLDYLETQGVTDCDLILCHLPHLIERELNANNQWKMSFTYHLAKSNMCPYQPIIPVSPRWGEEIVFFCQGDSLPRLGNIHSEKMEVDHPLIYFYPSKTWSGCVCMIGSNFQNLSPECQGFKLPDCYRGLYVTKIVRPYLSVTSLKDFKKSNEKLLPSNVAKPFFPKETTEICPGIWMGENVTIHKSQELIPPVFIGANCRIEKNVTLGPNVIVEHHSVIDKGTTVQNSMILCDSYVGQDLFIKDNIVKKNLLIDMQRGKELKIRDEFILSDFSSVTLSRQLFGLLERCLAACLFVLVLPLYLFLLMFCKLQKKSCLYLPACLDKGNWKTFNYMTLVRERMFLSDKFVRLFRKLPVIINIMNGDAHFVGVEPKTVKQVEKMDIDLKRLYLKTKVGMITLSSALYGLQPTKTELISAEVYYAVNQGFLYDLHVILAWLLKPFKKVYWKIFFRDND